jgi:3-methylfumaryl-CoA hydratase
MRANPVLLFRYSAVTFNGHRIHYDRAYTTEIEKYPGLLVHGPLQATLLVDFASNIKGNAPARFKFRAVQPLFDNVPFRLCATEQEDGLQLWIETPDRRATMQAEANW